MPKRSDLIKRSKMFKQGKLWLVVLCSIAVLACSDPQTPNTDGPDESSAAQTFSSLNACRKLVQDGLREVPDDRADRFLGKVQPETALCRGGDRAAAFVALNLPWLDWQSYWATGSNNEGEAGAKQQTETKEQAGRDQIRCRENRHRRR